MKPIIVDMKELSDSTEVYEARPNPALAGFIYLVAVMLFAAVVWMSLCKMDVVVKGVGTVAAYDEVSTVTNQVTGIIEKRLVQDGQAVESGDILYIINQEEQQRQLTALREEFADYQEREEILLAYHNWLTEGTELPQAVFDNLYYPEILTRRQMVELGKENTLQMFSGELSAYSTKLATNGELKAYYQKAVEKTRQLIQNIRDKSNTFGQDEAYYFTKAENFLAQYSSTAKQYEDKITSLQEEADAITEQLEELEAMETVVAVAAMAAVSGGDALADAGNTGQEEQLAAYRSQKETIEATIAEYVGQKEAALNAYEMETIAVLESSIHSYEQNILTCENAEKEYENSKSTLSSNGTELEIKSLVTEEQYTVTNELESCRQSLQQLKQQIENAEQAMEKATVTAAISGTVHFTDELVEGDYMNAGAQVLSIIPHGETNAFVVKSYIENKDIAKVQEGKAVTYEIAAYPASEYGTLRGEVTFVSADLKVNQNGSAYYEVETTVDAGELRNRMGEAVELKVGMLCETKVVVDSKSVLRVLMEKIFKL